MEVSGRQAEGPEDVRKLVEDQEGVGRGQEGPEEVGKAVGEGGRSGRTWESNGTLQYLPLKAEPSRPKYRAVIIRQEGASPWFLHTHHHPKKADGVTELVKSR